MSKQKSVIVVTSGKSPHIYYNLRRAEKEMLTHKNPKYQVFANIYDAKMYLATIIDNMSMTSNLQNDSKQDAPSSPKESATILIYQSLNHAAHFVSGFTIINDEDATDQFSKIYQRPMSKNSQQTSSDTYLRCYNQVIIASIKKAIHQKYHTIKIAYQPYSFEKIVANLATNYQDDKGSPQPSSIYKILAEINELSKFISIDFVEFKLDDHNQDAFKKLKNHVAYYHGIS